MNDEVESCIFLAKRVADQLFACQHVRVQPLFGPKPLLTFRGLAQEEPEYRWAGGSNRGHTGWVRRVLAVWIVLTQVTAGAADSIPAVQGFDQEIGIPFPSKSGVQLLVPGDANNVRVFDGSRWYEYLDQQWTERKPQEDIGDDFAFLGADAKWVRVPLHAREVTQLISTADGWFVASKSQLFRLSGLVVSRLEWPEGREIHQLAFGDGALHVACSGGLFRRRNTEWEKLTAVDSSGRDWAARDVLAAGFDDRGGLWIADRAGVGCRSAGTWRFYEGKDGLPWNDFTGLAAGSNGVIWLATHLGVIRFDGASWQYRQGPLWLPSDDVRHILATRDGAAWCATAAGVGCLRRQPVTLQGKAEQYEVEIEQYIKRTPLGFVAEAPLRRPPDKASADPQDSDNDGLWTAMYGAGECFAYAATKAPEALARAKGAFEALRFLQKVTQGGEHSPPKGYVARTVRPVEWPDPNVGRLRSDLEDQKHDKYWKAYEPRWPKSADGKWYWKSDTSSDELDGHYFFYPLYYDFCAGTPEERDRVREVVRDLTDHLMSHGYCLIDHDGKPTRWGVYGPEYLNRNPDWWQERGLKSLSILCYLSVAAHITGDSKYEEARRQLVEREGYAHNAMFAKVQQGSGSGNQSDDEMAFMCYYGLLNCSRDESLNALIRYSFYRYWVNEAPEMNPFFNFAYAGHNRNSSVLSVWGPVSLAPSPGWLDDSMATLRGFPLDRRNWSHRNSHRLDVRPLERTRSGDLDSPDRPGSRGYLTNGKVLPVENRHFNHWNTDPWQLDYGGKGEELAAGTVFLLPYYMGLYHGFIDKPGK